MRLWQLSIPVGFGRVSVISADLDAQPFVDWPDRLELVLTVVQGVFPDQEINAQTANRTTSFEDLAGQMRGTLDRFDIKRSFSFSFLAIILLLLIAAVGPIDYLLINRVWGKPLLGWLSLPLMVIGLSGLLVVQSKPAPATPESESDAPADRTTVAINQLQIIDVDTIGQVGRAFTWSYLYSHDAGEFAVEFEFSELGREIVQRPLWTRASPYGFPGREFGGIHWLAKIHFCRPMKFDRLAEMAHRSFRLPVWRWLPAAANRWPVKPVSFRPSWGIGMSIANPTASSCVANWSTLCRST